MTDVSSGDLAQFPGRFSIKTSLGAPFAVCALRALVGFCGGKCAGSPQYNCD